MPSQDLTETGKTDKTARDREERPETTTESQGQPGSTETRKHTENTHTTAG